MGDLEWFNNNLKYYLEQKENQSYKHLIEVAIASDDIKLKCDLHILLMHTSTSKFVEEFLRKTITELYSKDKNLDEYLDKVLIYNPKFGTLSISASHKRDMALKSSLYIDIPVKYFENHQQQYEEVKRVKKNIKEVLKMILVETKTIV